MRSSHATNFKGLQEDLHNSTKQNFKLGGDATFTDADQASGTLGELNKIVQ